jgi:CRP-like cAMP-binding protein
VLDRPGDLLDRVKVLRNATLLETVPDVELRELGRLLKPVPLGEGEVLAVRGQASPGLVVVDDGALEVLLESSPICSLSPGSLFGEDGLIAEGGAQATLRAASKARVSVLERKLVNRELARLPNLRSAIERAYRHRVLAARLYTIDLFQGLSPEARAKVINEFDAIDLPGGSYLAREGETADVFYVIREGEATIHLPPGDDGHAQTATLKVGDYVGDTHLLEDRPHTATVSAPYEVKVMKLDRKGLRKALGAMPDQIGEMQAALKRRSESILI